MTNTKNPIPIGHEFRRVYADGNCLWTVTKHVGPDHVEARINDDDLDYGGVVDSFRVADIQASAAMDGLFRDAFAERDRLWANATVGETLHYHNSFGKFVRGEVVVLDDGTKGLKCTALVSSTREGENGERWGGWDTYDLTTWFPDGTVRTGYHVDKVVEGDAWQAPADSIYEWQRDRMADWTDPRTAEPESLDPPERDVETIRRHKRVAAANVVIAMLQDQDPDLENALATLGEAVVYLPKLASV